METLDEVLSHYGVKGMRWGVRRTERQLARARKSRKTGGETSKDAEEALRTFTKAKTKGTQSLSNEELKTLNARLNLERNFESLTKSEMNPGAKFAQQMLLEVGKQEVQNVARKEIRRRVSG